MQNARSIWWGGGLLCVIVLYLTAAGFKLSHPALMVWDEKYYVPQAQSLAAGSGIRETSHPPLGKFLTALSIAVCGDTPAAWRLPALLGGVGVLWCVYALGVLMLQSRAGALTATVLLACESLAFVQSRTAVYSSIMLFLELLSILLMMTWRSSGRWLNLVGAAVAFGAAVATRWVALSALPIIGLLAWNTFKERPQGLRRIIGNCALFVGVSAFVYIGLFVIGPLSRGAGILDALKLNVAMFSLHWANLSTEHRYASQWWTWPLLLRPVWWGFESYPMTAADGSQVVEGILSIGNPIFFAAIPCAVVYGFYKAIKQRSFFISLLLVAVFTQWLQWAWVPRNTFLHYFYTVLPFAALLIADMLLSIWRSSWVGRVLCLAYLTAAVGMFVYWYPLLTAMQVSRTFVMQHIWLESWW